MEIYLVKLSGQRKPVRRHPPDCAVREHGEASRQGGRARYTRLQVVIQRRVEGSTDDHQQ